MIRYIGPFVEAMLWILGCSKTLLESTMFCMSIRKKVSLMSVSYWIENSKNNLISLTTILRTTNGAMIMKMRGEISVILKIKMDILGHPSFWMKV